MAGPNFTQTPNIVVISKRDYHTISTQAESMKKEHFLISGASPQKRWRLSFTAITQAIADNILSHYDACYEDYEDFLWTSVPSYLGEGSSMTGRWLKGSLTMTPLGMKYWNVEIVFEEGI